MEQFSLSFKEEISNIFPVESSYPKLFNSSSKVSSKHLLKPSKFVISPKKEKIMNIISTNEKSEIYSLKRNYNNKKKEVICDYRPICRKLDFSENSDNFCNNSNYSISDNDNIEINEDYSEYSNEVKNSDYSSSSLEDGKQRKKKYFRSKKDYYIEKEMTFMKKKQSSDDFSLDLTSSRFDEEYVIIKTLCNGEMGTVYLCFRIKDKKKYVVKTTKYFSRKLDYENMNNFVNDINRHSNEPENIFIQKYIDFWIEDIYEKSNKSTANNKNMYIVTDYCINGNLKEYLSNIKNFRNIKLNYFFYWDIIFQMIIPVSYE